MDEIGDLGNLQQQVDSKGLSSFSFTALFHLPAFCLRIVINQNKIKIRIICKVYMNTEQGQSRRRFKL